MVAAWRWRMDRRTFVRSVAVGVASLSLPACESSGATTTTLVIAFSQVRQWFFAETFRQSAPDWSGSWGLRYHESSSGSWLDPEFVGWGPQYLEKDVGTVERIVFTVGSLEYNGDDPAFWDDRIARSVATIREKVPTARSIYLHPILGGPNDEVCLDPDGTRNRSAFNHPYADAAIARAVDGDPELRRGGGELEVLECSDFEDWQGHLTTTGRSRQGERIGRWYSELEA